MAKNPYLKDPDTGFDDVESLSKREASEQAELLRAAIRYHDRRYYVDNDPVIADAAYDRLFARLQDLESAYVDLRTDDSPTQRVGGEPIDQLHRVEHTAPMLSLDSVLERQEVDRFHARIEEALDHGPAYDLEPKFDGLSIEAVYDDGDFVRAATRGDGREGDDISHNVRRLRAVPLRLDGDDLPTRLAVRGEVYMPTQEFHKLNKVLVERGDEPFANPRTAAAGTIRQLDPSKVAAKYLRVAFYDLLAIDGKDFDHHKDVLDAFVAWGLPVDPHRKTVHEPAAIADYHQDLLDRRDDLDYEIDGVVIKLDDLAARERLGTRARSPRWALAWKFPPRKEVTTLRDVVVQVGRTGHLTPVALLDPVDVGGVTVSRATLHNEEQVKKKDVRPGDTVRVHRAGDVIPEIVERIATPGKKRGKGFKMPDACPVCGADVVREGAFVLCPAGPSCPAQLAARVQHYASRSALDIGGLGEKVAKLLVREGLIDDIADLYQLDADHVEGLEGFAHKKAKKLVDNIQDKKEVRLDVFLYGLGIPHVGREVARRIAEHLGTLKRARAASADEVRGADGVGQEIARSVVHFFGEDHNQELLDRLVDAGLDVQDMPSGSGPLDGKTFVFTGGLEHYTRAEAKDAVESLGAHASSSVSRKTDYVVVGSDPGSKRDEATEHGVKVLDETAFRRLLKRHSTAG